MVRGNFIFKGVFAILLMNVTQCYCKDPGDLNSKLNLFTSDIDQHLFRTDKESFPRRTLIWSPLSTYAALLPLLHGAKGSTKSELENLLHFPQSVETEKNSLKKNIRSEERSFDGLKTATGLFLSNNYELNENFVKSLESTPHAAGLFGCVELQRMDLSKKSGIELAYQVNHWVNVTTDAIITQIVQPDAFTKDTKLILVNAIQFKAKWRSSFQPYDTKLETFYGIKELTQVPMMFQRSTQDFGKFKVPSTNDEFQVLKLGYEKNELKLLLILPNDPLTLPKVFDEVMNSPTKLSEIIEQLEPTELDIYLPKFRVDSDVPIKSALQKAGLKKLFSQTEANLTDMINLKGELGTISNPESNSLYLNDLIQKTVFEVDETGTKAGAATTALLMPLSGFINHRIQNFTLDKPFIVVLRDSHASTVFQGIIYNIPSTTETQYDVPASFDPATPIPSDSPSLIEKSSLKPNESKNLSKGLSEDEGDADSWWIHKGKPEYLQEDKAKIISEQPSPQLPLNQRTDSNPQASSIPPRFQQPEPKHPQGIRFPYPGSSKDNITLHTSKYHTQNLTDNQDNSNYILPLHKFHGENLVT